MSWAEVKKINSNMSISLDELLLQMLAGSQREYIYESRTYTIPYTGTYTIRAFEGKYGSYGKVVKNFTKGEILTITINSGSLVVRSNLQTTAVFHINLTKNSYVNSNSADSVRAIAIGGAEIHTDGGHAYVRSNNGIAAGGGGSGGGANISNTSNVQYVVGKNGGNAYAYGTNVYALGGGGGGAGSSGNSNKNAAGLGGKAFINGSQVSGYCAVDQLKSGAGENGGNSYNGSSWKYGGYGGNGGCGGGCGYERYTYNTTSAFKGGGLGYFSDGGYVNGSSAKGGDEIDGGTVSHTSFQTTPRSPKGYFVGGMGGSDRTKAWDGGTGGFLGGNGSTARGYTISNGGYSPYGFGGKGGSLESTESNITMAGKGGDGKLFGGDGGDTYSRISKATHGGQGGNGYYPGKGGIATGTGTPGADGRALTNNIIIGTAPLRGMTPTTSIVIIERGDSPEDF